VWAVGAAGQPLPLELLIDEYDCHDELQREMLAMLQFAVSRSQFPTLVGSDAEHL
jgi:hypothetical protein